MATRFQAHELLRIKPQIPDSDTDTNHATTNNATASSSLSLTNLPPEPRLQIYSYTFSSPTADLHITTPVDNTQHQCVRNDIAMLGIRRRSTKTPEQHIYDNAGLLCTNKLIRCEAMPVIYQSHTFVAKIGTVKDRAEWYGFLSERKGLVVNLRRIKIMHEFHEDMRTEVFVCIKNNKGVEITVQNVSDEEENLLDALKRPQPNRTLQCMQGRLRQVQAVKGRYEWKVEKDVMEAVREKVMGVMSQDAKTCRLAWWKANLLVAGMVGHVWEE